MGLFGGGKSELCLRPNIKLCRIQNIKHIFLWLLKVTNFDNNVWENQKNWIYPFHKRKRPKWLKIHASNSKLIIFFIFNNIFYFLFILSILNIQRKKHKKKNASNAIISRRRSVIVEYLLKLAFRHHKLSGWFNSILVFIFYREKQKFMKNKNIFK